MEKFRKQVLPALGHFALFLLSVYLVYIMLVLPLWRWGYLKQKDAIDFTLLSIVGAIVSLLSIVLAIVFQRLSSKNGKQLEGYIKEIRFNVATIKTLTRQITKNQENETTKLISTLGNIATQLSKQTWKPDDSH